MGKCLRIIKKIFPFLFLIPLAGCGLSSPPRVEINVDQAKTLGDQVALDYFDENSQDLYPRMDLGFKNKIHNEADLKAVLHHIHFLYGNPTAYDFKVTTYGHRSTESGLKSYVDVWYILRTRSFPKGDHYLKIEVVQADGATFLDVGGLGILTFPDGLPTYLK
jgi:hypothetical protein